MKIDFTNENDVLDLRLKYKNDYAVIQMLNEIEDLQDRNVQLKIDIEDLQDRNAQLKIDAESELE